MAITALAAAGLFLAQHYGLSRHLPSFVKSHTFKLATEIGSPIGALFSISGSILITRRKRKAIDALIQTRQRAKEFARQRVLGAHQRACHTRGDPIPRPKPEVTPLLKVDQALRSPLDAPQLLIAKRVDRSIFGVIKEVPLIPCEYRASEEQDRSINFARTKSAKSSVHSHTIDEGTVDYFLMGMGNPNAISLTISSEYKRRKLALIEKKKALLPAQDSDVKVDTPMPVESSSWIPAIVSSAASAVKRGCEGLANRGLEWRGVEITTNKERRQLMADAIAAAMDRSGTPCALFVRFEENVFVARSEGIRINLYTDTKKQVYTMLNSGVTAFSQQKLWQTRSYFAVANSELQKRVTPEQLAGVFLKRAPVGAIVKGALVRHDSKSTELGYIPSNVPAIACMTFFP